MYDGIQPPFVAFYGCSIRFHVESAMKSIGYINYFYESIEDSNQTFEITGEIQNQVLNELQNILVHGASISRYFWPSKPGKNDIHLIRGNKLKEVFNITEESALKSRTLRNKLEHFDENLDIYLNKKPIVGHIFPAFVGNKPNSDGVPSHLFRAFYIDTGEFEVLGATFEVKPIADEIYKIHNIDVNGA